MVLTLSDSAAAVVAAWWSRFALVQELRVSLVKMLDLTAEFCMTKRWLASSR